MFANTKDQSDVISAYDVARELGISRSLAYAIMKSRGFPSMRIGAKRIVVYRKDFEKWLAEQK